MTGGDTGKERVVWTIRKYGDKVSKILYKGAKKEKKKVGWEE